MLKIKRKL